MRTNKYAGLCYYCNNRVGAKAGQLLGKIDGKWQIAHLTCNQAQDSQVSEFYFPSTGTRVTVNKRGKCIDAPCCGCCTV